MANPYHDEQGRFTSGPGAGQVGKGAIVKYDGGRVARVEAQDNDRLIVSSQTTDRFGRATYGGLHRSIDPKSIESVESLKAKPVKVSGRGSGKAIDVTKQFASGKSPFSLITHIGGKPVSPVREKVDGKWRNIK